jgi:membrane protein DedA with SNARE-associated domain
MPFRKFLLWDGLAACLSIPPAVLVGYFFHDNIDWAREKLSQGQTVGFVIIGIIILVFISFHLIVSKKFAKAVPEASEDVQDRS